MMQYQVSPECTMVEVAAFLSEVIVCMHPMWCYKRGAIALLFQRDALSFMHSPTSGLAYVADGSSHIITSNSKSIYYAEDINLRQLISCTSLLLSLANVTSRYPSSSFGRQRCCHVPPRTSLHPEWYRLISTMVNTTSVGNDYSHRSQENLIRDSTMARNLLLFSRCSAQWL